MGVTIGTLGDNGSGGWSVITASAGTNIIYCSDSIGNDLRDGSTPTYTDDGNTIQFALTGNTTITVNSTYSDGAGHTFTVSIATFSFMGPTLQCKNRTGTPASSGTLTLQTGSGTSPLTYTAMALGIAGPVKTLIKALGGSGPGIGTGTDNGDVTGLGTLGNWHTAGAGNGFGARPGQPDWVLLKEGDTWTDQCLETGTADGFRTTGLSPTEPFVVSSYDPSQPGVFHPGVAGRPLLKVPNGTNGVNIQGARNGLVNGDNIAVVGIDFYSYQRDPLNVADYVGKSSVLTCVGWRQTEQQFNWQLIEDCRFRSFGTNIAGTAVPSMLAASSHSNNCDIDSANWTPGSGWSIADVAVGGLTTVSTATGTATSSTLSQTATLASGTYRIAYIITVTSGSVHVTVGNGSGTTRTTSGTYMEDVANTTVGSSTVTVTGVGFTGTVSMVMCYPVNKLNQIVYRRNVNVGAWEADANLSHCQGWSLYGVIGSVLVEESLFDKNGYNHDASPPRTQDIFSRNVYVGFDTQNVTWRRNISANSGSEGVQFRTGGLIYDSLFVRGSYGFDIGHIEATTIVKSAEVYGNCIWESEDKDFGARGLAINYNNCLGTGVHVHDNILAHYKGPTISYIVGTEAYQGGGGVDMQSGGTGRIQGPWQSGSSGTHGILDENNIWYDWGTSGLNDEGSPDGHGAANTFSNPKSNLAGTTGETFVGSGVFYPRPGTSGADGTNSVGSYHATLGQTATTDAFLAIAANQCKNNWNTNYTTYAVVNYLKGGFGIFVSQGHKNLKADI